MAARAALVVAIVTAGFGPFALPAWAQERKITVRLADGSLKTLTLDVPDDAPLSELKLPGPIVAVDGRPFEAGTRGKEGDGAGKRPRGDRHRKGAAQNRKRAAKRRRAERGKRQAPGQRRARSQRLARLRAMRRARGSARVLHSRGSSGFSGLPNPALGSSADDFLVREFRVPPFLLPVYHAAAARYGVPWEILAAVNEIESDYGRNPGVSSAGAVGWMQFMPGTWRAYGLDANRDGHKDPYNPIDAIFSAARYLEAFGARSDVHRALFAYNHAHWYVGSVLSRARLIAAAPDALVGTLTGLAEGRFPVSGRARYPSRPSRGRRAITIRTRPGAPVVAVNDGVIRALGRSERLGRYLVLEDLYGNRYTYARLESFERSPGAVSAPIAGGKKPGESAVLKTAQVLDHWLPPIAGGLRLIGAVLDPAGGVGGRGHTGLRRKTRVVRGAVLGRAGRLHGGAGVRFAIRPGESGATRIDPKPVLEGWRLLERAGGSPGSVRSELFGKGLPTARLLAMPKSLLARRVLSDERIEIYRCGRRDIRSGRIDSRVLVALIYLTEQGLRPSVTSLKCGHNYYTASGNVSEHSTGSAVDIARINGTPIFGHQEPGGVTEQAVRQLLALQGTMTPHQIISLLDLGGPSFAMADHADHIHLGFRPLTRRGGPTALSGLSPGASGELISRLVAVENPSITARASRFALSGRSPGLREGATR